MTTELVTVAALSSNRVIGNKNKIPWDYPEDRKHYKSLVENKVVIAGRVTYEMLSDSMNIDRAIVLTSDTAYQPEKHNPIVVNSKEEALSVIDSIDAEAVYNLGGGSVYELLLPETDRMILTHIWDSYEGDAYFPEFERSDWEQVRVYDEPSHEDYSVIEYKRVYYPSG